MPRSPKRTLKRTGYLLLGFIAFLLVYLLIVTVCSYIPVGGEAVANGEVDVFVRSNGVHTDIVVPVRSAEIDWSKEVLFSNTRGNDTGAQYLAFGWGDKGFYLETPTWGDLKASTAFKAASGLGASAIHTTFYKSLNENDLCKKVRISRDQYKRMVDFIQASFRRDRSGHLMKINTSYGISDAFYEARGHYSMFYTCNTWTNQLLRTSGMKCCLWTIMDKGILAKYK